VKGSSNRQPDANGVCDTLLATEPSGDRWLRGERGGQVHLLYVGAK
jgi:hypothetical protein